MKIFLICTSQNIETEYFMRFINSLETQPNEIKPLLTLIFINQSEKKYDFSTASINYVQIMSSRCNLSIARNIGLQYIYSMNEQREYIVAFPDDDCWYNATLLKFVLDLFKSDSQLDFICTGVYDDILKQTYGRKRILNISEKITNKNALDLPVSVNIFIRSFNGFFDENLSIGARWGSGEESDVLLQMLQKEKIGIYNSFDCVYHEVDKQKIANHERTYKYALGLGAVTAKSVIRKQQFVKNIYNKILFKAVVGKWLYLCNKEKRAKFIARINGMKTGYKEGIDFYKQKMTNE